MTNEVILFLKENLTLVDAPDMEPDFNYAVSANLTEAERIAKQIQDAIKPNADFKKYEEEAMELREQYAEKDALGEPIFNIEPLPNGQIRKTFDIPGVDDPNSEFNKKFQKLREKHKEAIEKREEQLKFLDKENKDFKPMMVQVDQIPKGLSRRAMDAVFFMTEKPKK